MTTLLNNTKNALRRLHTEEDGMEAMQTVLITVLSVVILAFSFKVMTGSKQPGANGTGGGGIIGQIGDLASGLIGGVAGKVTGMIGL